MPYSPKDFGDVAEKATMAPSELQPPLNFADGGAVNWAGDSTVYNTQSQIGNMMATPGGFGGMSAQFTSSAPFSQDQNPFSGYQDPNQMQDQGQEQGFDFSLGTVLQPMPTVAPPPNPTIGSFSTDAYNSITPPLSGGNTIPQPMDMPEAAMAKGGNVSNLISRLKGEFSKRGLDFDRAMAQRLANKGQKGDTMLAHINPDEAQMLKNAGGSGKINPDTGLPSFGVDDGPERGSTGSASGASYGGGSSIGSGGGSNQSANAAMGRESPSERDYSYTGGGNDRSDRSSRESSTSSRSYDRTTKDLNAQRASQEPSQTSFTDSALNALGKLFGITPAEAGTPAPSMMSVPQPKQPIYNDEGQLMGMTGRGRNYYTTTTGLPAVAFATSGGKSVPIGVGGLSDVPGPGVSQTNVAQAPLTMPNLRDAAEIARVQAQRANEVAAQQVAATPSGTFTESYNPQTEDPFASQMANLQAKIANLKSMPTEDPKESPFAALAQVKTYNRPFETETAQSSGTPFSKVFDALISPAAAAENKLNQIAQMTNTPWPGQSNAAANVPFPVPRDVVQDSATPAASTTFKGVSAKTTEPQAPVLPAAKTTTPATQPADQGILSKIMSDINNANAARIAELEKQNQFIGGNKEQVAAALNVDPSELQSRIVNYDGTQKVDYFTKGMDQALAEMVTGPFQAIGNLFGSNVNQTPRGSYVRDPRFSDLFSQNVPSKGYGPYGDLTLEEYNKQYGGRDQQTGAGAPVTTPTVPVTPAPEVPATPSTPLASFKRKYIPLTEYANYGYGPESTFYEYQAAQGGSVGPLSQKRK